MKHVKTILLSVLALTLIAGIATAALAATNDFTKDIIAQNQAATADAARRDVFPAAESFAQKTLTVKDAEVTYYEAQKGDELLGYVFTTVTRGKSAGLTVMTGVNVDGTVCGVKVTEDGETAGYIDTVTAGGLFEAFVGKTSVDGVDTVSQATKTSHGVIDGVELALSYFAAIK